MPSMQMPVTKKQILLLGRKEKPICPPANGHIQVIFIFKVLLRNTSRLANLCNKLNRVPIAT